MFSIIIPAHNEASVISDTLSHLQEGAIERAQVIVSCNGCDDETAAIARSTEGPIEVIEIEKGSKPHALNVADNQARFFPRVYIDADIRFSSRDICKLVEFMQMSGVPAAVPRAEMDFEGVSWPVRAYYTFWFSLPYVQSGMVGCGVYALSKEGRSRFDRFPDLISDDGYVRAHFKDSERPVVPGCTVIVRAPRTLAGLIKIKTRSRLGGRQLRQKYPELFEEELANPRYRTLLKSLVRPSLWPAIPAYLLVVLVSLWRSRRQMKRNEFYRWERDETSRVDITY